MKHPACAGLDAASGSPNACRSHVPEVASCPWSRKAQWRRALVQLRAAYALSASTLPSTRCQTTSAAPAARERPPVPGRGRRRGSGGRRGRATRRRRCRPARPARTARARWPPRNLRRPGQGSTSKALAPASRPGQPASIPAWVSPSQMPVVTSWMRGSIVEPAYVPCDAIIAAVCRARPSGLTCMARAPRPPRAVASSLPLRAACSLPRGVRGESSLPWKCPSVFQAVSPWRTRNTSGCVSWPARRLVNPGLPGSVVAVCS